MTNERLFTDKANVYNQYRAKFPPELVDRLLIQTKDSPVVTDIGAGTGLFTELLLERKLTVFAVEPNADMRLSLAERFGHYPNLTVIDATAENTGLAAQSVDLVTAARAFHWFDTERFKAECQRILTDGGKVAVLGAGEVRDNELYMALDEVKRQYSAKTDAVRAYVRADREGHKRVFETFFKGGVRENFEIFFDREMTREQFIGDALSRSYAPGENDASYNRFVADVGAVFDKFSENGTVIVKCVANADIGEV